MNKYSDNSSFMSTTSSSTSLPQPVPKFHREKSAVTKRWKYLRRLIHFQHMDFEFAFWQMFCLFVSPQKMYRNFQYRKQTKNQFARDDPAFLVLLGFWLIASSMGLSIVLQIHFIGFCKFLLWVLFIDCIGVGLLISTALWFIANKYLKRPACHDQNVEWGYAFDVHLNAFFPLLIILHIFQLFFYHLFIYQDYFISRLVGNSLWLIALGYYIYITFLGYSALPILERTHVLLYPFSAVILLYIITLVGGYNVCRIVMDFYRYRVL